VQAEIDAADAASSRPTLPPRSEQHRRRSSNTAASDATAKMNEAKDGYCCFRGKQILR
jgi:hypothetical protein